MLTIRIVIHVDGGVVQDVMTPDDPNAVVVILADYDWESMGGDDKPVGYYPVQAIDQEMYQEYVDDVDRTVAQLTGMEMPPSKEN